VLSYSFEALESEGPDAMTFANREGLWAHEAAIALRLGMVLSEDDDPVQGDDDTGGSEPR
ncbi:MAG: hypothetical protein M1565_03650, partial [Actinobacteria bacterium]|nr:hypothetical protein [Actinomycetota bacterium]